MYQLSTSKSDGLAGIPGRMSAGAKLVWNAFDFHQGPLRAAALTYSTILSLVPLLAIAFAILKGLGAQNALEPLLLQVLGESSRDAVARVIGYVNNTNVRSLGWIGLGMLIITVLSLLSEIEDAFNAIWGVKESRSIQRRFSDYLSVVLVGPLLLIVAMSMTTSLQSQWMVQWLIHKTWMGEALLAVFRLVPYISIWVALTFLYIYIPNTQVRLTSALIGGVVSGTLWQVAQWGYFHFQVGVSGYNAIYGTLAALPIFMIWLYTSWMIVLFGLELVRLHQLAGLGSQHAAAKSKKRANRFKLMNRRRSRRFGMLAVIILLAAISSIASSPLTSEAASQAQQTIRVVMDDNYPPFIFKSPDGKLQGMLVEQWQLWEKKTGVKVELTALDWAEAQRRMQAGEFDVIDTIFKTPAREKLYDFTPPYQKIEQPLYFNSELTGIKDARSLGGFTVAAKDGGAIVDILKKNGITSLELYPSYESIILAAKQGKVAVFTVDRPAAVYFMHKHGVADRFKSTEPLHTGEFHRAVRKGDSQLLALVTKGFSSITKEEYEAVSRQWLGSEVSSPVQGKYILLVMSAALAIVLLLVLSNLGLRKLVALRTAELQRSEELYRQLVQSSDSIILRWKRDGTLTFMNDYALKFFGYTEDEVIGKHVCDTIVPKVQSDGLDLSRMMDELFDKMDSYRTNLNQNRKKNGQLVWISWNNRPVLDEKGNIIELLSVGSDVTALKNTEQELLENRKELEIARHAAEAANEAKSLFLANMSHEIRTPLNAVIGMNSILAERLESGELKELAKDSMSAANNLLDIISDVLDLSKIEAGKLELMEVVFEPRQIISQLERMFKPMMLQKRLNFEVLLAASVPECLVGDPARIQQIGVNLLSNAIKFTDFGTISLLVSSVLRDDGRVELQLTVTDTGKGITPENIEHIFKPFIQENLTTTRKFGGTGLGLTISRHLAEMMGGGVYVESRVGDGSSFTSTVVCSVAEKKLPARISADIPLAPLRTLDILVAEDSVVNRKMMEAILRMEGHRATYVENGCEAVSAWQNKKFDLVLMDIQMPEMDGMQATRQIREAEANSGAHVPIIALTAYAMAGDRERFLSAGMDDYLAKPITVEQLRVVLQQYGE